MVSLVVTLCGLVNGYERFGATYRVHVQLRVSRLTSSPQMECRALQTLCYSKLSVKQKWAWSSARLHSWITFTNSKIKWRRAERLLCLLKRRNYWSLVQQVSWNVVRASCLHVLINATVHVLVYSYSYGEGNSCFFLIHRLVTMIT